MASSEQGKLAFALVNFVGRSVQVQTMTGMVYEGIFHAVDLSPGKDTLGVALRKAYKKADSTPESPFSAEREQPSRDRVIHELLISGSDVAQISAVGIDLGFKPPPPEDSDGFTDTGISGGHGVIKERKLQAWSAGDGDVPLELEGGLGVGKQGKGSSYWSPEEMFKKNKEDHNYKSTWDESDYTTKINTDDPAYARKAKEADRLAREIMGGVGVSNSKNPQLLHDRHGGQVRGMNEEDLFGSVQRAPLPGRSDNAWVRKSERPRAPHGQQSKPPPSSRPSGKSLPPPGLGPKRQQIRTPEPLVDRALQVPGSEGAATMEDLKQFHKDFELGTGKEKGPTAKKPEAAGGEKPKSTLNPKAVEFKFNPGATEFKFKPKAPAPMPPMQPSMQSMPQMGMMGYQQQPSQQQMMVMPQQGQYAQPMGMQPQVVRMPNGQMAQVNMAMVQQQQMQQQQMQQQQRMMMQRAMAANPQAAAMMQQQQMMRQQQMAMAANPQAQAMMQQQQQQHQQQQQQQQQQQHEQYSNNSSGGGDGGIFSLS